MSPEPDPEPEPEDKEVTLKVRITNNSGSTMAGTSGASFKYKVGATADTGTQASETWQGLYNGASATYVYGAVTTPFFVHHACYYKTGTINPTIVNATPTSIEVTKYDVEDVTEITVDFEIPSSAKFIEVDENEYDEQFN